MEFIQNYNWSITIGLVLLVIAVIIGGAYFLAWYGKLQAKLAYEYEKKYAKIEQIIDTYKVCELNFDWLNRLFDHLYELKYKDPERTEVLYNKFREKYSYIIAKRKVEDVI